MEKKKSATAFLLSLPIIGESGEGSFSITLTRLLPTQDFNNSHCLFTDKEVLPQNGSNVLLFCFSDNLMIVKTFFFFFKWDVFYSSFTVLSENRSLLSLLASNCNLYDILKQ